jgi:hypothetical protein
LAPDLAHHPCGAPVCLGALGRDEIGRDEIGRDEIGRDETGRHATTVEIVAGLAK